MKKRKIILIISAVVVLLALIVGLTLFSIYKKPAAIKYPSVGPKTVDSSSCQSWGGIVRQANSTAEEQKLNNTCRSGEKNIGQLRDLKCPCYCCMPAD
jgi:hypothetical protein